ncbi:MAG: hypothetical protein H2069_01740 [Legionella sp.]|nr:hypothetical protein [Legionella sp.]
MKQSKEPNFFSSSKSSNILRKKNTKPEAFEFSEAIRDLGKVAIKRLEAGAFDELDPLVSDWSCQLRTLWLISILEKLRTKNEISDKEYDILGMYYLLTLSKVEKKDAYGMSMDQFTNLKYKPPGWDLVSNKKNIAALGTAKKELTAFLTEDLCKSVESSNIPYKDAILRRLKDQTFTTYSEIPIRFVEFFTGYLATIELALEKKIPVVIALTQFTLDNKDQYKVNGSKTLFYKPSNNQFIQTEPSEEDKKTPCIAINMYSGLNLSSNETLTFPKTGCLLNSCFSQFVENFKSLELKDLILTIAATHPQFTSQTFLKKEGQRTPITALDHCDEISKLLQTYKKEGIKNHIGINSYFFNSNHFYQNIPINTKHVYVSTFSTVDSKQNTWYHSVEKQSHCFHAEEPLNETTSSSPKMM